jgi:hypothetical protein
MNIVYNPYILSLDDRLLFMPFAIGCSQHTQRSLFHRKTNDLAAFNFMTILYTSKN